MSSPWSGDWVENARPVIRMAPDCIVYINGLVEVTSCLDCHRKIDINNYVTGITTDLSVENAPGSASISLCIPIHDFDNFRKDGVFIINPMMEIEIHSKGAYHINGECKYYPIFWGVVTTIQTGWSGGEHTVSINCADITKWWELTRVTTQRGVVTSNYGGSIQGATGAAGHAFEGWSVFQIFYFIALNVAGDNALLSGQLESYAQSTPSEKYVDVADVMSYWMERFKKQIFNIRVYGLGVKKDNKGEPEDTFMPDLKAMQSMKFFGHKNKPAHGPGKTPKADAVRMNVSNILLAKQLQFQPGPVFEAEQVSRLELANQIKDLIGYEFYMDSDGGITFKPPWYNMNVMNLPTQIISDKDVISWSESDDESRVYTVLKVAGSFIRSDIAVGGEGWLVPQGIVVDHRLAKRYGYRMGPETRMEYYSDPYSLWIYAVDRLDVLNSKRRSANVEIPHRPEIRMGIPIYMESTDTFWYVLSVNHSLTFSGRATTSLTLTAPRSSFTMDRDMNPDAKTSGTMTAKLVAKRNEIRATNSNNRGIPNVVLMPNFEKLALLRVQAKKENAARLTTKIQKTKERIAAALTQSQQTLVNLTNLIDKNKESITNSDASNTAALNVSLGASDIIVESSVNAILGASGRVPTDSEEYNQYLANSEMYTGEFAELNASINTTHGATDAWGYYKYALQEEALLKINEGVPPADQLKSIEYISVASISEASSKGKAIFRHHLVQPVSDEFGYEVYGNWPYGRGWRVNSTGKMTRVNESMAADTIAELTPEIDDGTLNLRIAPKPSVSDQSRSVHQVGVLDANKSLSEMQPLELSGKCLCSLKKGDPLIRAVISAGTDHIGATQEALRKSSVSDLVSQLLSVNEFEFIGHSETEKELSGEYITAPGLLQQSTGFSPPGAMVPPPTQKEIEAAGLSDTEYNEAAELTARRKTADDAIKEVRAELGHTERANKEVAKILEWAADLSIDNFPKA